MPKALQETESGPNKPVDVGRLSIPVTKAFVVGGAIITMATSLVTAWHILSGGLASHVADTNVHVPADHYREHGLPVGVRDFKDLQDELKTELTAEVQARVQGALAPVNTKLDDVQDMLEAVVGERVARTARRRGTARRVEAAAAAEAATPHE